MAVPELAEVPSGKWRREGDTWVGRYDWIGTETAGCEPTFSCPSLRSGQSFLRGAKVLEEGGRTCHTLGAAGDRGPDAVEHCQLLRFEEGGRGEVLRPLEPRV